jgi:hypothetical protein
MNDPQNREQDFPGVKAWVKISHPKGTPDDVLTADLVRKLDDLERGYSDTCEEFAEFRKSQRRERKRSEKRLRFIYQWPRPGFDWLPGDLVRYRYIFPGCYAVVQSVAANGQDLKVLSIGSDEVQLWPAMVCDLVRRG